MSLRSTLITTAAMLALASATTAPAQYSNCCPDPCANPCARAASGTGTHGFAGGYGPMPYSGNGYNRLAAGQVVDGNGGSDRTYRAGNGGMDRLYRAGNSGSDIAAFGDGFGTLPRPGTWSGSGGFRLGGPTDDYAPYHVKTAYAWVNHMPGPGSFPPPLYVTAEVTSHSSKDEFELRPSDSDPINPNIRQLQVKRVKRGKPSYPRREFDHPVRHDETWNQQTDTVFIEAHTNPNYGPVNVEHIY